MNQKLKKIKEGAEKLNTTYYKFVQPYIINLSQLIGKGSFGQVWKGADIRTYELVAVKQISNKTLQKQPQKLYKALKNQIQIMKKIKHQNIVTLYDTLKSSNNIYLFIELCDKGSLQELIKKRSKLTQKQVIQIARQLIQGYYFLHCKGILHRDLKPANILIKDDYYKIADFGFAKLYEENKPQQKIHQTLVGSPIYMCPQILNGMSYSTKCDVWSLGVILYQLLFGKPPFIVKNLNQLIKAINKRDIKFPFTLINRKFQEIIKQMLIYQEAKRISWKELYDNQFFHPKKQSLEATLKNSIQIVEKLYQTNLKKSQAINKMYFQENKVIQKVDLDKTQQQQLVKEEKQISNITEQTQQTEDLFKSIVKKYNTQQQKKALIKQIAKYFLNKRNKAVFLNHLSLRLYDLYENKKINIPIEVAQIILLVLSKYQCGIIYKSYLRLKEEKLLNCKKFKELQFKLFVESPLKKKILQNFANDFKVMKMFLDELIIKVRQYMRVLGQKKSMNEKYERILKICNGNLCAKQLLRKIYQENMESFLLIVKEEILNNNNRDLLEMGYLVVKAMKIKQMTYQKSQYNRLYQQVKKLQDDQLKKMIFQN